jgi:hypothetical protein
MTTTIFTYDFLLYRDDRPWRKKFNPKKCAAKDEKDKDKQCPNKAEDLLGEHKFCRDHAGMIKFFGWQQTTEEYHKNCGEHAEMIRGVTG